MKRKFRLLIGLVILAMVLVSCAPAAPGEESEVIVDEGAVRVAFVGPLTGPGSADLRVASNGAQLAVYQRNDAGGICDGREITLVLEDDKADPKEGATVATKLVEDSSILAVAHGWNSSVVLAAAPIFNEAGLLQVNYFGVAPAIREAGPYTFRVVPTGDLMAQYLAYWMIETEGFSNIAGFYENTDYGKGLFDVFEAEANELGVDLVGSEAVLMDQRDFSAIISRFKALNADSVIIFGQYEAAAFWARQAEDLDFEAPLFGSDGIFAPELISLGGDAVEGIRSVAAYTLESQIPYVANFVQSFRDTFDVDPNNGAGYAYDAMVLMLDALDGGGCTREGAQQWMTSEVVDHQGATGIITFDEMGDRLFQEGMYIKLIVQDGSFVELID